MKRGTGEEWGTKKEAREQLFTTAAPNNSPVISDQRADAQVPSGIYRENVRPEIHLLANLCEVGEFFTIIPQ